MTTLWTLAVLERQHCERWASLTLQPPNDVTHADLAVRLQSAGLRRLSMDEWTRAAWPLSRCTVTVEQGILTQFHTGRSRVLAADKLPVGDEWQTCLMRGKVILSLIPPATSPDDVPGSATHALERAIETRMMLSGLAAVRYAPEPYGRRW